MSEEGRKGGKERGVREEGEEGMKEGRERGREERDGERERVSE